MRSKIDHFTKLRITPQKIPSVSDLSRVCEKSPIGQSIRYKQEGSWSSFSEENCDAGEKLHVKFGRTCFALIGRGSQQNRMG